jgi:adenine-specific DNA-methyltransferase
MLNENGKIGFVIPAELLQVVYAEDLRAYLTRRLNKITIISFDDLVFNDAEQEIIVLIGEKNNSNECIISNCSFKDLDDLQKNYNSKELEYTHIINDRNKWTKYYLDEKQNELIEEIRLSDKFQKFGDVALINVGITTGNNDYFSINKETLEIYDLEDFAMPLIGRSSQAHGLFFDKNDWEFNINKGVKAFLLNFEESKNLEELNKKQQLYIKYGEKNDANKGYKCKIRKKWYSIPSIWIPDAFFLRRSNNYPKFVMNKINAVSTDTMHRINFYEGVDKNRILLSYYNSITFAFIELNGRSYGGGVLEILPKEVSNVMLPIINNISDEKIKELLSIIDEKIRSKDDIENLLNIMDKELLENNLGIPINIIKEFRVIWKFMTNRRHNRNRKNKGDE